MYFLRKICLYIIIILLIVSLYNDFKKESYTKERHYYAKEHEITAISTKKQAAARIKFDRGDTFLSISERLNGDLLSGMSIDKVLEDFEKLNPHDDVHSLRIGHYYLFPLYEKTELE